ncbi:recombinase family protein [Chloroflexota bacterium]
MRAALYARVSREEQMEGYSIDAQRRAFQTLCQTRDWTPHQEYIEEGRSAHTENINKRPVFKSAIADTEARQFDVLIIHKVDRFSRKERITKEYFEKLGNAGVGFLSIMEQMDFSTPWGKFTLTMLGGLAELYSDNLSQETKKGWAERKAQGLYCGLLPFGAMKSEDGVPVPDTREIRVNGHCITNYDGLITAFKLAAQGKTYREVAITLSSYGYRTAGNQGNRPFSKDTIRDMLQNRFYLGELPNGSSGWVKGRHNAFVSDDLFKAVQKQRIRRLTNKRTINTKSSTYSLSTLMRSRKCGSKFRIQANPKGEPRVYCAGRAKGFGCACRGTFLRVYESQLRWHLNNFIIPPDYQLRILKAHKKLQWAYSDTESLRKEYEARQKRLGDRYDLGHISRDKYLAKYNEIERQLKTLPPKEHATEYLDQLADFLKNITHAWDKASHEQKNRLAQSLFEEILVEDNKVVAAKPQPELEPFFRLDYECHTTDIAGDPDGGRGIQTLNNYMLRLAETRSTVWLVPETVYQCSSSSNLTTTHCDS